MQQSGFPTYKRLNAIAPSESIDTNFLLPILALLFEVVLVGLHVVSQERLHRRIRHIQVHWCLTRLARRNAVEHDSCTLSEIWRRLKVPVVDAVLPRIDVWKVELFQTFAGERMSECMCQ